MSQQSDRSPRISFCAGRPLADLAQMASPSADGDVPSSAWRCAVPPPDVVIPSLAALWGNRARGCRATWWLPRHSDHVTQFEAGRHLYIMGERNLARLFDCFWSNTNHLTILTNRRPAAANAHHLPLDADFGRGFGCKSSSALLLRPEGAGDAATGFMPGSSRAWRASSC